MKTRMHKLPNAEATTSAADVLPIPLPHQNHRTLRVLIVDDHAIVRGGLKQIIADKFPQASFAEAANVHQAVWQLRNSPWDVMLLDITMPGRSGLDLLREARAIQPKVKILVVTMHPEDQYAMRVLKLGASGYLTKEKAANEVIHAVERVLAGGKYISAALAEHLVAKLHAPAGRPPHEKLSDREYEIMVLIAGGKSAKEIAADLSLSIKTISTYRTRLLKKMRFKTNADLIRYAMRERLVD
jgi:DNA-binding NarL/FixJ family response regulator